MGSHLAGPLLRAAAAPVEAFTRLDDRASQCALERNGLSRIGIARRHIFLDGDWRFFERITLWAEPT